MIAYLVAQIALGVSYYFYAISGSGAYENGGPTPFPSDPLGIAGAGFGALVILLTSIALLAGGVRRLHDRNKTGWWIFVFAVLPYLLASARGYLLSREDPRFDTAIAVAGVTSAAFLLWGLVELGFLRGTSGQNGYGPDPLGAG